MEHLPVNAGGRWTLQVPYLPETPFTFEGEWVDYPKDQGISLESIRYLQWSKIQLSKLAPFLQNWLFFGMLRAVIPREIDLHIEDFIRTEKDGKKYITTSKLVEYMAKWIRIEEKLSLDERLNIADRHEIMFKEASQLTYSLTQGEPGSTCGLFPAMPVECAVSCALLGQALQFTNVWRFGPVFQTYMRSWTSGDFLLERLESQGWCPFIISGLSQDLTTMYYMSTLGGPKIQKNHRKCTEGLCLAAQNEGARHAAPCSSCALLRPSIIEVVQAIRQDNTPIMQYLPTDNAGKPSVKIAVHNESSPYIAISHVWADGLGTQNGNEANLCQLDKIQRAVDRIFEQTAEQKPTTAGWWWLDTLCVPKGDAYNDDSKKAVEGMREIYIDADGVLLIDSELCQCEDSMDALQVLSRLCLSNWARRLWTFQEGYFAGAVYILVGSTPRSLIDLVDEVKADPGDNFQQRILWDLLNVLRPLFGILVDIQAPMVFTISNDKDIDPINIDFSLLMEKPASERTLLDWLGFAYRSASRHLRGVISLFQPVFNILRRVRAFITFTKPYECLLTKDKQPVTERAFSDVVRVVCHRTSTYAKDEALCLALLLKLATPQIKEVIQAISSKPTAPNSNGPSEPGMVKLLEFIGQAGRTFDLPGCIPPSIIFPVGPRLKQPGFQWVPESFLSKIAQHEVYSDLLPAQLQVPGVGTIMRPSGNICEHGLRVMFPGLIITKISDSLETFFLLDTAASPPVQLNEFEGMPEFWRCKFHFDESGRPWTDIAPTKNQSNKLAIIVGSLGNLGSGMSFNCILVRIEKKMPNGEYRVSRLGKMLGSATPAFDDFSWLRQPWNRAEGSWLPLNQMWCVD